MIKKVLIFFFLVFLILNLYSKPDRTTDKEEIFEKLRLKLDRNNAFLDISDLFTLSINNKGNLMYRKSKKIIKPIDKIFPTNYLMLQARYIFPVKKAFGIGPTLFNENVFKILHYEDSTDKNSTDILFYSIILPGLSFTIMPYHSKMNIPIFMLFVDIGPGIEINNDKQDGDGLVPKFGGYSVQTIILPIMPVHLFVMDINVFAVLATSTPIGWFPGVFLRNIFLMKFAFFNFANKKSNSGLRIKNSFRYTLTGRPSLIDLTSQYTYDKLDVTLYFGGVKGLEIHAGYGFEYITFARDPIYHIANKVISELSWEKAGFKILFRHYLIFWDKRFPNGIPVNQFDIMISYSLNMI